MGAKVLVAMSGGVDSSVAAWLLQRQGYECVGVTMKLYTNESAGRKGHTCCALEDVEDAREVARRLDIPYYVFNFTEEFDRQVMRRFAQSYRRGDTPNPCIDCNRYLKFGALLHRAQVLGMDYIATGHYARICLTPESGRWAVRKAADPDRDQSYVLASMTQDQLAHTLFPLGRLHKSEVRRIAEEQGFVNARKHDSQDICFVPDGDYGAFLARYTGRAACPGDILDREGRVLGRHRGAECYTLGQRKGLGVSAAEPLYVCGKSMADNTVTLGPESALYGRTLLAGDWVWGAIGAPREPLRVWAKVRYRQTERPALAEPLPDGTVRLTFDEPQRAITTGQAVVLYRGDTVLGGGTITAVP
ncbi:MAG: tRNA 2-thiouridine(34) synthase MnmA [Oscillibacter sp.]|nr:tRNA 2-thiouridine(34) synthase MnmA [Oscillibacter sp.]